MKSASQIKNVGIFDTKTQLSDGSNSWPRWQWALAVGVPVAVVSAAGVWYYRRRSSRQSANRKESESKMGASVKGESKNTSTQIRSPAEEAQSIKNTGNKYFKGGKFDKAIQCYTQAISLCPTDNKEDIATFYQNRAAAYEQLKNYDKVIEDCSVALEHNARYVKAYSRRAKAAEIKKDLVMSLEDITAVCILENFGSQQSLLMADRVLKDLSKSRAAAKLNSNYDAKNPSDQFIYNYFSSFANDPLLSDQKTKEIEKVENDNEKEKDEAMEKDTTFSPFKKAMELMKERKYDNIIKLCTDEINLVDSPSMAKALLLRATFYALRGDSMKAMDDFDKLLNINDLDKRVRSNAYIKRASVKMQLKEIEECLEEFNKAIKIDPENSDIYHHRGQINLVLSKYDEAVEDFKKCVALCPPDFAISHVQKLYIDVRKTMNESSSDVEKATEEFEKTLEKFPDCAEGFGLYGQLLVELKQFRKADDYFIKAQNIDPNNGNIAVHRGLLRLHWQMDLDEASRLINEAIKVEDRCVFAYETLGTIEIQRGNLERAIELFNKALDLVTTEDEMIHIYSMLDAAVAQGNVAKKLGITLPGMPM